MRLLPVLTPYMSAAVLALVGASALLSYGFISTALVQNQGACAQGPGTSLPLPALQMATPLATPEPLRTSHEGPQPPF